MFSLIISIIAIALAAVLLLTSAFYGGDALTEGTAKAEAAALANEAQQISAGYDLFKVEKGGAIPAGIASGSATADVDSNGVNDTLVEEGYLKAAPDGWTIGATGFENTATDDVCGYVNASDNGLTCDLTGGSADSRPVTFPF